ncbi:unnamed protein product [Menidia menidia]|uniref:(Atlantic silverside) hypothetical protein n=1 Tax=Menidia menidia TaxID=238744 RepID=A0A8S4B856_9TELE|nr:unnamed protein product [Menidia menidia]
MLTWLLLKIIGVWSLVFLPVKQDPVVGGKPPRSPILSRRSYLSPLRGRRRLVQDALHGGGDPYQALYNYIPRNEDELELKEGDIVDVMEKCDDGWFVGKVTKYTDLPKACRLFPLSIDSMKISLNCFWK